MSLEIFANEEDEQKIEEQNKILQQQLAILTELKEKINQAINNYFPNMHRAFCSSFLSAKHHCLAGINKGGVLIMVWHFRRLPKFLYEKPFILFTFIESPFLPSTSIITNLFSQQYRIHASCNYAP